jgi:cobalt transporter subunit CbtB
MNPHVNQAVPQVETSISVLAPAILALVLGAFLVIGVGFAQADAIHNAAHDTRHSLSFPCH